MKYDHETIYYLCDKAYRYVLLMHNDGCLDVIKLLLHFILKFISLYDSTETG